MADRSNDVESVFQIDDPEIDVETIMNRIREGLAEHALDDAVEFPTFAIARARYGEANRFPEELYYHLEQANLNYDQVWVESSVIESRVPLIGGFITRFKRELHRLVVYYVNLLGERQVTMNDALLRTLNQLVENLEQIPLPRSSKGASPVPTNNAEGYEQPPEIEVLRCEIVQLRERLEKLEARVESGE